MLALIKGSRLRRRFAPLTRPPRAAALVLSTGEERSAGSRGDGFDDRSGFDGEAREREGSALASCTRMPRLAACNGPCVGKGPPRR